MPSMTQNSSQPLALPKLQPAAAQSFDIDEKPLDAAADTGNTNHSDPIPLEPSADRQCPNYSQYTLQKRPWRRRVTDFTSISETKYRGSGTPGDPFIVQWLDNDQENPKNFSNLFKWTMTMLLAFLTLCVSLASSAYTGAALLIIKDFHCSREVFLLGLSFMVFGFALGPLLWAPISEAIGRREILFIALAGYIIFTGVCAAAQDITTLIVIRFLCGTFGSAVFVIPVGQLSDIFEVRSPARRKAVSMFTAPSYSGTS